MKRHDEIVVKQIEAFNGAIILERGEGDSVFAVFTRDSDAVAAAFEIQREMRQEPWPNRVPMRVRMAIHTGEADADYRSPHVNRAARIRAIGHGEQILISGVTAGIVRGSLPEEASLIDLGSTACAMWRTRNTFFSWRTRTCEQIFHRLSRSAIFGRTCPCNLRRSSGASANAKPCGD